LSAPVIVDAENAGNVIVVWTTLGAGRCPAPGCGAETVRVHGCDGQRTDYRKGRKAGWWRVRDALVPARCHGSQDYALSPGGPQV